MASGFRTIWIGMAIALAAASIARADHERPPTSFLEDAGLHDVAFVNAELGWAVGDRGVIWHTATGGKTWRMQASPVGCRLDSLSFLDELNGFAAGGFVHPYTHQSTGVILRTRDGGKSWQSIDGLTLPALTRIRMFDDRRGFALGYGSGLFPAGVFSTSDGGRTWTPLRGMATGGWLAADFRDPQQGVVAGSDGSLALVRGPELVPPRVADSGPRRIRDLTLAGGGWLVGQEGLLLTSTDGGSSWLAPPQGPPRELARQFDFTAVAARGTHVWIAGSPGSIVFHSADGGRTWESQATGQTLPLAGLHFATDQHGWAVGALGTILATTDGGHTWRRQRSGGTRAALLGIFSSLEATPLELIAGQAAGEGYLTAVEIIAGHSADPSIARVADMQRRGQDAIVGLGGSQLTIGPFPLPDPGVRFAPATLIRQWDQAARGDSRAILEERLVRAIRMWRPEVVVTHAPTGSDEALPPLVAQIVSRAAERANDPNAYPHQRQAGLATWPVRKVFGKAAEGQSGSVNLTQGQFLSRVGRSLGECAATAEGFVVQTPRVRPASIGFQTLIDHLPAGSGRNDFFSGINLPPGGEARRTLDVNAGANLDEVRRLAARRRNMQQLVERAAQSPHGGAAWLAQTGDLTRDMSDQAAGELLFSLAEHYRASGRLDLAAETHDLLIGKYPKHSLAEASTWWLLQYYSSGEVSWREQSSGRARVVQAAAPVVDPRMKAAEPPRPEQVFAGPEGVAFAPILAQPSGHIVTATLPDAPPPGSANAPGPTIAPPSQRRERAIGMARLLERSRPALFAEAGVKLPAAAASRALGLTRDAEGMLTTLANASQHDAWWSCAQAERWIAQPRGPAPKAIASLSRTPNRPRLDGQLSDPTWRFDKALELRGSGEEEPATVLLSCDDKFLYVAATCPKVAGCIYAPAGGVRSYDGDLAREDRIEVLLDIDRDYASYYRLTIDHRGWTGESCFGDKSWNPQWFVAASQTAESWTIEAAIPLAELAANAPTTKQPWALGVQRIIPGVGFQSWTQPATPAGRPEGFGLLGE